MAQIFIAHSRRDKDLRDFFSNVFGTTNVKPVFEEFEKILKGKRTSSEIEKDIQNSKAVFVVLSQNVQDIPCTRDWVVWETGVAKNKDIWIFEPYQQLGNISVVIPYLRHYVIFNTSDAWFAYICEIIKSYDDSHVLPTLLVAGGIGALLAEKDKTGGAALGALAGLVISDKSKDRPTGIGVTCKNCSSSYNIHIQQDMKMFRCPVCNTHLKIAI
ncbi:MAG TPA: hypothetical protein VMX96_02200 [Dehalococcoidia bacterium]|nr:hypothetical protein [Dehalococcoidia bacterium]